jgi:hypothetical protein
MTTPQLDTLTKEGDGAKSVEVPLSLDGHDRELWILLEEYREFWAELKVAGSFGSFSDSAFDGFDQQLEGRLDDYTIAARNFSQDLERFRQLSKP